MAGVMNTTARQFNLSVITKNHHVKVRLKPGFNTVDDKVWKSIRDCDYVQHLKKLKFINYGSEQDDKELDATDHQKAATKVNKKPEKKKDK